MFRNDISVIRAVHSDRIRRHVIARSRPDVPRRESALLVARRSVGHSIVRLGARIANEPGVEPLLRLAR